MAEQMDDSLAENSAAKKVEQRDSLKGLLKVEMKDRPKDLSWE